jgi:hypothetical protein
MYTHYESGIELLGSFLRLFYTKGNDGGALKTIIREKSPGGGITGIKLAISES